MPPERRVTVAEERAARSQARRNRPKPEPPILRFDKVERTVHWVNASLFGILMLTGAALYAGPISALVGNRETVRFLHVYSGLLLPIPIFVGILGRHGKRLRTDFARLNRWTHDDVRWFRRSQRHEVALGKFNPGQKLNAALIGGTIVVMLGTGSIMKWFELFPLDWRTGATFVHDWFALLVWVLVLGHIAFAVRDGDALESMMVNGKVPATWARTKAPLWYEELRSPPSSLGPPS